MIPAISRKNWTALAIALCASMLVVLAGLQFHWTGQISEAQATMMESALGNSARQFELELSREIATLSVMFEPRGRPVRRAQLSNLSRQYSLWRQTSSYPELLQRLLVYTHGDKTSESLWELLPGQESLVATEWDHRLGALPAAIDRTRAVREGLGRDLRLPSWMFFPASGALVRALPQDVVRSDPPPAASPRQPTYLILEIDWAVVTESILPELVARFFSGPDGDQIYHVAIVAEESDRILYRSEPSIDATWLADADISRHLRIIRDAPRGFGGQPGPGGRLIGPSRPPAQGPRFGGQPGQPSQGGRFRGPPGQPAPPRRQGDEPVPGGGRLRQVEAALPAGWSVASIGRAVVLIAGRNVPVGMDVAAWHVSGSLAGAVARQRERNLATGLGVLLLLGGATVLVLVSARRARRLAGMQMEFIAGVTHELRTPLAVICSVGENLADGVVGAGDQVKRYGTLIRDQGRRLADMVEQTLEFASMESRQKNLRPVPLDAVESVETALAQARPSIEHAGFSLEVRQQKDLPLVLADEKAVQQILSNLLSNAVKYGEPGRWVGVETIAVGRRSRAEVQIRVRDRGMGIREQEGSRIFDAFYRGKATANGDIEGSGLGLKLARDLAVGMGGNLSFRSRSGRGTVFTLHLPLHASLA